MIFKDGQDLDEGRDCSKKGLAVRRLCNEALTTHRRRSLHLEVPELARLLALAFEEGLLEGQSRVTANASGAVRGEKK